MPLVFGAIAVAMLSVLRLQTGVSNQLTDQGDAQVISSTYQNDVQGAAQITTAATPTSPAACVTGSQYQILGLVLGNQSEISYAVFQSGTHYDLVRNECVGASQTQSHVVARDVPSSMLQPATNPVTITCGSSSSACQKTGSTPAYASGWQPTVGITGVTFATTEPGSSYTFQLTAVPAASVSSTQLAQVVQSSSTCGFALPGTGTYASTLCFVDFTNWNAQTRASGVSCSGGALPMSSTIANSPFILTFCLSASGTDANGNPVTGPVSAPAACGVQPRTGYNDVAAVPLPTYACPPSSEAFLGNNGFYTGVPGDPALYLVDQGSSATVSVTNIKLVTSAGVPATNWALVTGDAESTDANESITWSSDKALQLMPNSPNSPVGNACDSTAPGYNAQYLTGLGTTTVQCGPTPVSADHTGTVMLRATAPTSLTVTLNGGGLEALFFGVLLS